MKRAGSKLAGDVAVDFGATIDFTNDRLLPGLHSATSQLGKRRGLLDATGDVA